MLHDYDRWLASLAKRPVDIEAVKTKLKAQRLETPSWAYGKSGSRFKTLAVAGMARNVYEKLADAAYIHRLTGITPAVALHMPWDKVEDWAGLREYARGLGLQIGAIHPNVFQADGYRLGSICHPSNIIREEAIAHMVECCEIMRQTGSHLLSLWFADGTNYSGQDSLRERKHRLENALKTAYQYLPYESRMLIAYKLHEPAFYHSDLADWGMVYAATLKLGEQAQVLVDTGQEASGHNVAHITAFLMDEGRLGGIRFNARPHEEHDLIVGSHQPFALFELFVELVSAGDMANGVALMIDHSHHLEPKLETVLLSVLNCQMAYAKALLVDFGALKKYQQAGDVLGAHRVLVEAFEVDVRPLLAQVRREMGLHPDPVAAYRGDGYARKMAVERESHPPQAKK